MILHHAVTLMAVKSCSEKRFLAKKFENSLHIVKKLYEYMSRLDFAAVLANDDIYLQKRVNAAAASRKN